MMGAAGCTTPPEVACSSAMLLQKLCLSQTRSAFGRNPTAMKAGGDAMAEMNAGDRAVFQIGGVKDQQVAPVLVADILHREQKAVAFGGLGRARRKHGF